MGITSGFRWRDHARIEAEMKYDHDKSRLKITEETVNQLA